MHFTSLGYSRPSGQTSDHWTDVAGLKWEPEFYEYVRDSFAPVGVMIDAWAEEYEAGRPHEFAVVIIDDLYQDWRGTVRLRLLRKGRPIEEQSLVAVVPALGKMSLRFSVPMPAEGGPCQLEAVLKDTPSGDVRSLRDFAVTPRGN